MGLLTLERRYSEGQRQEQEHNPAWLQGPNWGPGDKKGLSASSDRQSHPTLQRIAMRGSGHPIARHVQADGGEASLQALGFNKKF